jgi:hypothetical protein
MTNTRIFKQEKMGLNLAAGILFNSKLDNTFHALEIAAN